MLVALGFLFVLHVHIYGFIGASVRGWILLG